MKGDDVMRAYTINISTHRPEIVPDIMVALSKYDCDIRIEQQEAKKKYPFSYADLSFLKLGEKKGRTPLQYKNEMKLFQHAGLVLNNFGISCKHKGYVYAVECIRLINTYGMDDYSMDSDVYPVVGEWYGVSPNSIEHNIRNAINIAWEKACDRDDFTSCPIAHFSKKPSNIKFLKHVAKITNYSLCDAEAV